MAIDFAEMVAAQEAQVKPKRTRAKKNESFPAPEILPAVVDKLNLPAVKQKVKVFDFQIVDLKKKVLEIVVESDEQASFATALAGEIKKLGRDIEAIRVDAVAEPNEFVKGVNAFCKQYFNEDKRNLGGLNKLVNTLLQKITDHNTRKEIARREAEKKQDEERQKLQAKLDMEAQEKGVETVALPAVQMTEESKTVKSETGATSYVHKEWICVVESPDLVPREYCVPLQSKLDAAVKQGVREIPGCKVWEKESTRLRV